MGLFRRNNGKEDAAAKPVEVEQQSMSTDVDTLEKVARGMYREIIYWDEMHPDEVPANDDKALYASRLKALGVKL